MLYTRRCRDAPKLHPDSQIAVGEKGGHMARKPMTKARMKRLIGVGTTVAPLLAPYAMAAAGAIRGGWDSYRAGRLGVSTDKLAEFTGPGGGLHARVSHLADALNEIQTRTPGAKEFAEAARPRLVELATAVRAAEQMPTSRRRTAFKAISIELDGIEQGVLTHLGITT
ncbi:MAG TPA: DUF6474 family protein [Pseudonocardia sp.]